MSALMHMRAFTRLREIVAVMPPWMTMRAAAVLVLLADGSMRCKLVALTVDLPAPAVSRVFDTLAAHGLLTRVRHTGHNVDGALTPAGLALAREIVEALEPLNRGRV